MPTTKLTNANLIITIDFDGDPIEYDRELDLIETTQRLIDQVNKTLVVGQIESYEIETESPPVGYVYKRKLTVRTTDERRWREFEYLDENGIQWNTYNVSDLFTYKAAIEIEKSAIGLRPYIRQNEISRIKVELK